MAGACSGSTIELKNPAAIWERPALWTQAKMTLFMPYSPSPWGLSYLLLLDLVGNHYFGRDDGQGRDQPSEQQRRRRGPQELRDDERGRIRRPDPREGVAGRARQCDGGVREGRGRREPVRGGDVRRDGERHGCGAPPRNSPDDREQAEGGDELAQELSAARARVSRSEEQRLAEHAVSNSDAEEGARHWRGGVGGN